MYCARCGYDLSNCRNFCPRCGNQISNPSIQHFSRSSFWSKLSPKKRKIIIFSSAFLIAVIVFLSCFIGSYSISSDRLVYQGTLSQLVDDDSELLNNFFQGDKIISFEEGYGRGFGLMAGIGIGYTHTFKERWVVDAFFAFDRMWSWYNDYLANGEINLFPRHQKEPKFPDPFKGSAEWIPSKIGVSIGY